MFCFLTTWNLSHRFNMINVSFMSTWLQICVWCWHHILQMSEKVDTMDDVLHVVLLMIRKKLLGRWQSVKGHYVNRIFMQAFIFIPNKIHRFSTSFFLIFCSSFTFSVYFFRCKLMTSVMLRSPTIWCSYTQDVRSWTPYC